ncbi:hypothetical protein SprV_0301288700 [Sparganum proliferum]
METESTYEKSRLQDELPEQCRHLFLASYSSPSSQKPLISAETLSLPTLSFLVTWWRPVASLSDRMVQ